MEKDHICVMRSGRLKATSVQDANRQGSRRWKEVSVLEGRLVRDAWMQKARGDLGDSEKSVLAAGN